MIWLSKRKSLKTILAVIALVSIVAEATPKSQEEATSNQKGLESVKPYSGIVGNFSHSFSGYRLGLQIGAVAATATLSVSGADAKLHNSFASGSSDSWANPAIYAVYIIPPVVDVGLFLVGNLEKDNDLVRASFAGLQAAVLTLSYVTVLKFFTGRPAPDSYLDTSIDEQSHNFKPGLGRGGVVFGWPSGHTAVTAAFASSIAAYYDRPALWIVASCMTAYIAAGMTASAGASQHWFSDTVAGALMGYSIGSSVGEGFREVKDREHGQNVETSVTRNSTFGPIFLGDGTGIRFILAF